ncbi:VOC family protein [Haliangium sp.]|uniref:VOC family protein n=1 Tax=Haliangium sp. TaxID=2663208 RepID=UPI003D0C31BA
MPHSKLQQILIDCQTHDIEPAVAFWSQALHLERSPDDEPGGRYIELRGGDVGVLIQRVEWPSSYHIDIEADDVDAEAERLEALGATKKHKLRSFWVMRAPTGHDFCVVPRQAS